jgi:hypothetical protein
MLFSRCDYDESDLAAMQAAFDGVVRALGLTARDKTQRERIAEIICVIGRARELDPAEMQSQAIEFYRQSRHD